MLSGTFYRPDQDRPAIGVLLFHGLRSDSREFGDFPTVLAACGFAALSFDFSGHGNSTGRPLLVTAESHYDDALAALDYLSSQGASPVTVVGHSFGAHPALKILAGDERVNSGILVSPQSRSGAGLTGHRRVAFRLLGWVSKMVPFLAERIMLKARKDYGENFTDTDAVRWAEGIDWDPGRVNLGTLAYARRMDNVVLAGGIEKPVLMITGDADRKVPAASSSRLSEAIPSKLLTKVTFSGVGHSPFAPPLDDRLLSEVCRFLQQHDRKSPSGV